MGPTRFPRSKRTQWFPHEPHRGRDRWKRRDPPIDLPERWVSLVMTRYAGARAVWLSWLDRYGYAMAGALIVILGMAVTALGV